MSDPNQPGLPVRTSGGLPLPTPVSTAAQDHTERLPGLEKALSEARRLTWEIYEELPAITANLIADDVDKNYRGMYRTPSIEQDDSGLPPKSTGGSDMLPGPMHTHPFTWIQLEDHSVDSIMDLLLSGLDNYDEHSPENTTLNKLMAFWMSLNSLKLLHRFLDGEQPVLLQAPYLVDGSNLIGTNMDGTSNFTIFHEWQLRRQLVRLLHLPGLIVAASKDPQCYDFTRLHRLELIYKCSRGLLEHEVERVRADEHDDFYPSPMEYNMDDMAWLAEVRHRLQEIFVDVLRQAYLNPRGTQNNDTEMFNHLTRGQREQNFRNNTGFGLQRLLGKMIKKLDELLSAYPFGRLVVDLLDKENTFERRLTVEHIEDKLINKQVSLLDEANMANHFHGPLRQVNTKFNAGESKEEKFVYRILADIALTNRQRRNFRLLRDWRGGRPWARIWQLYDSSIEGNEWQAEAIRTFADNHTFDWKDPPGRSEPYPTCYFSIAKSLFDFNPVDMAVATNVLHIGLTQGCFACKQKFQGDQGAASTVFRLHCGHNFHQYCIFNYWDEEGRYLHRCPQCRTVATLNFVQLGITNVGLTRTPTEQEQFVHNIWNYGTAAKVWDGVLKEDQHSCDLYDVPPTPEEGQHVDNMHEYWMKENLRILLITENTLNWSSAIFEPGQTTSLRGLFHHGRFGELAESRLARQFSDTLDAQAALLRERYVEQRLEENRRRAESGLEPRDLIFADISQERILEHTRAYGLPQAEAAFMRSTRRKKDRLRRRQVASRGLPRAGGRTMGSASGNGP